MIYKSYNFVESYSNADGTQKNGMVLSELGKVIRNEPNAVILALKDAGIRVPRKATRRDIVRIIVANKRNRKLSENLAILITGSATQMKNAYLSADGLDAPIPTLSGSQGLQGLSRGTQGLQGTTGTQSAQGEGFLKGLGNWLSGRQEKRSAQANTLPDGTPAPSGFQRFQNWFNQNRGTIGQVAQTTYDSLNRGGVPNLGGGFNNTPPPIRQETWVERNRGVVIVGALAIIGGVIYFATRKKA
jgi:hypothetical protein